MLPLILCVPALSLYLPLFVSLTDGAQPQAERHGRQFPAAHQDQDAAARQ